MTRDKDQAEFLARVRDSLGRVAAWPKRAPISLKPVPALDRDTLVEQFVTALKAVGGFVYQPTDDAGVCDQVAKIAVGRGAKRVAWIDHPNLEGLELREALAGLGVELGGVDFGTWVQRERDEHKARAALRQFLASADMAISGAQHAIAETGTFVLTTGPANPRSATNLPTVHVAVIRPAQIVATLFELAPFLAAEAKATSCLLFITGPSRTSDIEQISTVGVHGPVELHVIVRM